MGRSDAPTRETQILDVDGRPTRVAQVGTGAPIVLLHGWGGRIESWGAVPAILGRRFRVVAVDLPGFGETPLGDRPWGNADYAAFVAALLRRLDPGPVTLVGHSHGGRIALALAAREPALVSKLILVDSAGVVPRRTVGYHAKVYGVKAARRFLAWPVFGYIRARGMRLAYSLVGSKDYNAAGDPVLRQTLVRCVNDDLKHLMPDVGAPTLLIWGSADHDTPLADAKIMERLIPDAGLVIFDGAGHFSYLDRTDQFCRVVTHFVEH
jgi:pimeloyl-ACP methyl ester carboxylesterase